MSLFKILRSWKIALALALLLGALLRLYRLSDYLQFLGDEGRDALIVMHMIVNHQWTLLGPTASVGGFYIGGLYYYFMLPFLWLFRLDPIGPAYMSVLFGMGTIVLGYYLGMLFWSKKAGLLIAFLFTISPHLINISRFSWNPNPMPFFSLAAIICLYKAAVTKKYYWTFLAGLCSGILLELHYLGLTFLPILGLSLLLLFPNKTFFLHVISATIGVLLGNSMFIFFELRHGFPNSLHAWEFLTRGTTVAPRSLNIFSLFGDTSRMLYDAAFNSSGWTTKILEYGSILSLVCWTLISVKQGKERPKIILLWTWLVLGILGVGMYRGTLLPHYYSLLYPLPYTLVGLGIYLLSRNKLLSYLGIATLLVFFAFEINNSYITTSPNKLINQTIEVDKIIVGLTDDKPYNFALVTLTNSDHAYRYFLELWKHKPTIILNPQIDPNRTSVTNQLIAVCEQKDCAPLGNPLWEVAGFGRAEIVQKINGPAGIIVYRLVHYKGP